MPIKRLSIAFWRMLCQVNTHLIAAAALSQTNITHD